MSNYTLSQIEALRAAIAEGVTSVSSGGRTVVYRSLADMTRQLRVMEAELEGNSSSANRRRYVEFQRGD
jgi:hypothetical protein